MIARTWSSSSSATNWAKPRRPSSRVARCCACLGPRKCRENGRIPRGWDEIKDWDGLETFPWEKKWNWTDQTWDGPDGCRPILVLLAKTKKALQYYGIGWIFRRNGLVCTIKSCLASCHFITHWMQEIKGPKVVETAMECCDICHHFPAKNLTHLWYFRATFRRIHWIHFGIGDHILEIYVWWLDPCG